MTTKALARLGAEVASIRSTIAQQRGSVGIDSPQFRAWLHGDWVSDPGLSIGLIDAWQSPYVRKGIDVLSRSLGWLPFNVGRETGAKRERKPIDNHWLPKLLARPNAFMSAFQLIGMTVSHLTLFGEAFWWKYSQSSRGVVDELWMMDPRSIVPRIDPQRGPNPIYAFDIMFGGRVFATVQPEDVVHFKHLNPTTMWRGDSPLSSLGLTIGAEIEMSKYNFAFFKRGAKIAGVLYTEGDRSIRNQTQADEIRQQFMSRYLNPHQVAVLWGGLKYKEVAQTQRDSEFIEGKKLNREEILMALGVPPVIVSLLDGATFANAHEQMRTFWLVTMMPLAQMVADSIRHGMLLAEPDLVTWFDLTNVEALREAYDTKATTAQRLFGIGMPYNDVIDLLQLPVKHQPWGDTSLVPFNLSTAQSIVDTAEADAAAANDPNAGDATNPPPADPSGDGADATTNSIERLMTRAWTGLQRAEVLVAELIDDKPAAPAVPAPARSTRDAMDELIHDIMITIGDDAEKISALSSSYFDQFFELGGVQMGELLTIDFTITDYPEAQDFLATKVFKIRRVNDTVREQVRKQLREGIAVGESADELAGRIRAVYNFTSYRSKTIARTEASSIVNTARSMVMKHEGVERREWMTAGDERVRETHQQENGNEVTGDESYPVTNLKYPGDPDGEPEEIIRCRCIEVPVLEDEERAAIGTMRASENLRELYWRTVKNSYANVEARYARTVKRFFNEQRGRVLALVAKIKP